MKTRSSPSGSGVQTLPTMFVHLKHSKIWIFSKLFANPEQWLVITCQYGFAFKLKKCLELFSIKEGVNTNSVVGWWIKIAKTL